MVCHLNSLSFSFPIFYPPTSIPPSPTSIPASLLPPSLLLLPLSLLTSFLPPPTSIPAYLFPSSSYLHSSYLHSCVLPPSTSYTSPITSVLSSFLYSISYLYFLHEGIDKKSHSKTLVPKLLDEFLFPASTLTQETQESLSSGILNISSKYVTMRVCTCMHVCMYV